MASKLASSRLTLLTSALFLLLFVAAQGGQQCNSTSLCSSSLAPCCSEFGYCGSDQFCLGGCNPLASKSITSCRPNPVCEDAKYTFTDNSRILRNSTLFDGNATAYDWVVDKGTIFNTKSNGGELALVLTEANGGTRISSTRYMHYGTVTATLKTGRWNGVVTAFIMMSDIKDEIDWEFPGAQTTEGQTNFFWQGHIPTTKSNGDTTTGLQDTYSTYHDYTIDWQPETLTFLVDGAVVRTVKQTDYLAGGASNYPNTPSRIQFSLWPAGISSSPPGTIAWAGGMIDYNDADYKSAGGQFYSLIESIEIKCADPTRPGVNITSYVYSSNATLDTPGIFYSNHSTLVNGEDTRSANPLFAFWSFFLSGIIIMACSVMS